MFALGGCMCMFEHIHTYSYIYLYTPYLGISSCCIHVSAPSRRYLDISLELQNETHFFCRVRISLCIFSPIKPIHGLCRKDIGLHHSRPENLKRIGFYNKLKNSLKKDLIISPYPYSCMLYPRIFTKNK